jgi:phosphopantothenoylcysteine decarboxylase/phosphopantothenate--cysteine ligase
LRADGHGVVPPSRVIALSSGTATAVGVPAIETVLEFAAAFVLGAGDER